MCTYSTFTSRPHRAGSFFYFLQIHFCLVPPSPGSLHYSIQPYLEACDHHKTSSVQSRVRQRPSLYLLSQSVICSMDSCKNLENHCFGKKIITMLLMELSSSLLKLNTGIPHFIVFRFIVFHRRYGFYEVNARPSASTVLQYSLYCDGLEKHLKYLRGMPIITLLNVAYSSIFTPYPYRSFKLEIT